MKKIGSILTSRPQNKTLQTIYFQHLCNKAFIESLAELHLPSDMLEILPKQKDTQITIHLQSTNKLLLTHLRTNAMELQEMTLTKVQEIVSTKIKNVELKFRIV